MKPLVWSLKEVAELFESRRQNRFDVINLTTGGTGLGKSTLMFKILLRMKGFNIKKHLTYSRDETIDLLKNQKSSYCWNDEIFEAGFKRTHYEKGQIDLIGTITKYRCNYNVFVGCLPVFFTLDKELLKLVSINIDVIGRGKAVLHLRKDGRRYTDDPWDVKINSKLEERWSRKREGNPDFKIPYHKYTTFAGYIFFNDATPKQIELYERMRDEKKGAIEAAKNAENSEEALTFYDKLLKMLMNGRMDIDQLNNICTLNNKKIANVRTRLNKLLKNLGEPKRVKDLLKAPLEIANNNNDLLNKLSNR